MEKSEAEGAVQHSVKSFLTNCELIHIVIVFKVGTVYIKTIKNNQFMKGGSNYV